LTLETSMKIKFELELDTEKQKDLDMVEDVMFHLQDVRDLLEDYQENLNKGTNQKKTNNRRR
jgi:hypothetical protein